MIKVTQNLAGTFKTGLYAANGERWYGQVEGKGLRFLNAKEYELLTKDYKAPELLPLPF